MSSILVLLQPFMTHEYEKYSIMLRHCFQIALFFMRRMNSRFTSSLLVKNHRSRYESFKEIDGIEKIFFFSFAWLLLSKWFSNELKMIFGSWSMSKQNQTQKDGKRYSFFCCRSRAFNIDRIRFSQELTVKEILVLIAVLSRRLLRKSIKALFKDVWNDSLWWLKTAHANDSELHRFHRFINCSFSSQTETTTIKTNNILSRGSNVMLKPIH